MTILCCSLVALLASVGVVPLAAQAAKGEIRPAGWGRRSVSAQRLEAAEDPERPSRRGHDAAFEAQRLSALSLFAGSPAHDIAEQFCGEFAPPPLRGLTAVVFVEWVRQPRVLRPALRFDDRRAPWTGSVIQAVHRAPPLLWCWVTTAAAMAGCCFRFRPLASQDFGSRSGMAMRPFIMALKHEGQWYCWQATTDLPPIRQHSVRPGALPYGLDCVAVTNQYTRWARFSPREAVGPAAQAAKNSSGWRPPAPVGRAGSSLLLPGEQRNSGKETNVTIRRPKYPQPRRRLSWPCRLRLRRQNCRNSGSWPTILLHRAGQRFAARVYRHNQPQPEYQCEQWRLVHPFW